MPRGIPAKAKKRIVNQLMSDRMKESWARRKANGNGNGNGNGATHGPANAVAAVLTTDLVHDARTIRSEFSAEIGAYQDIMQILDTLSYASRVAVRDALTVGT